MSNPQTLAPLLAESRYEALFKQIEKQKERGIHRKHTQWPSSPFHFSDSHIKNHSPTTVMKTSDQRNNPAQSPAIARCFAAQNV
jgi:hypothetical protein